VQQGYSKVCWLDTAIILQGPVEYYGQYVNDYGVVAVQDENKLPRFCSRRALRHFGLERHQISKWHLVGGSFYYFDFGVPLCRTIFDKWLAAEQKGVCGSQSDEALGLLHGHRHAEACMA